MQTKSKIQLIKEEIDKKNYFKSGLCKLMDEYLIEDSIFSFDGSNVSEQNNGYFEVLSEYNSIDEAISNYKLGECLRIVENELFQVGRSYKKISEISTDNKVIDVTTGLVVKNED